MAKLVVEPTDRCNLRCGHCPSGRHGGRGELDPGLFARPTAEAPACGIDLIGFTGGEPTLHSRFAELVGQTAEFGAFGLVTNGWSLPKHLDALLAHRHRLRMITFSLDGAREATHDALRGREKGPREKGPGSIARNQREDSRLPRLLWVGGHPHSVASRQHRTPKRTLELGAYLDAECFSSGLG